MDISKHPILQECNAVMEAIEECGASENLTKTSEKAGDLLYNISKLINEIQGDSCNYCVGFQRIIPESYYCGYCGNKFISKE